MRAAATGDQNRSEDFRTFVLPGSLTAIPHSAFDADVDLASTPLPEPLYARKSPEHVLHALLQSVPLEVLLDSLEAQFPDWFDAFASADADLSAMSELAHLVSTAPHPFLAGFANGKLSERILIAAITGRRQADFAGFRLNSALSAELSSLEPLHSDWFDAAARCEADMATSVTELRSMMYTAPHPYLAGTIYGRTATRIEIRALTGSLL